MPPIRTRRSSVLAALVSLLLLAASSSALALTTLVVTLGTDNDPGGVGEVGDLRSMLNAMNQNLNVAPDDYAIVFAFPMTIQLNGILPVVNNSANPVNVTIGNPGSTISVTIDGNSGAYPGLFVPTGTVTIQNLAFQNTTARGGNGGNGISGGGGGMGAGGAIYAPQTFLNGSNPAITLINVSINNTSAVGGNGGNSLTGGSATGNEGGGGGGGFGGHGGSVTTTGSTGGGGGGGFGGNGGDVTLSLDDMLGGGGGGGGGIGSRATLGTLTNLGHGGTDQDVGVDGNGYGVATAAGAGGGGNAGGSNGGGGGGGASVGGFTSAGGGGGGSVGMNGTQPQGAIAPKAALPSGGFGGDGGGGGGAAVVVTGFSNDVDGSAANGGHGGGGGGGAGTGAYDTDYTVRGGTGGVGGGGGGGGADQSGTTPAGGGNSSGGGGGAGGGPSNGTTALGGADLGTLGGGTGGAGANFVGVGSGGGGGGGGSGLGGAIFVDSNLNFTVRALAGVPTTFATTNTSTQAGVHGTGGAGATDGTDGSALGNSIFLRAGSSLTFVANDVADLLTLGAEVAFVDDTAFGGGGTSVFVRGDGTVVYNGTTSYAGSVAVRNATFRVNGQVDQAQVLVDRDSGFSPQRGTLGGTGALTGNVFVNVGAIAPDAGATLTLGSLTMGSPASSAVRIAIGSGGASRVAVTGAASLAGTLEIDLATAANKPGSYVVLTSSAVSGTFGAVAFTGATPAVYSVTYQPTYVQLDIVKGALPEIPVPVDAAWMLAGLALLIAGAAAAEQRRRERA